MRDARRSTLLPALAALLLLPVAVGGLDLHAGASPQHGVVGGQRELTVPDCEGGRDRHIDTTRSERRLPCAACARLLQQGGVHEAPVFAVAPPVELAAAPPPQAEIPGAIGLDRPSGRAPPVS
ncbi:MAG: hypothetical protein ACRD2Z_14195 [Thermoanaerobaculia bacterium]